LYVYQTGITPPFIHDLVRLAEKAGLSLTEEQRDILDTVSTFNLQATSSRSSGEIFPFSEKLQTRGLQHSSPLTVHSSLLTALNTVHGSLFTIHASRFFTLIIDQHSLIWYS
jgi:hypothetical protein